MDRTAEEQYRQATKNQSNGMANFETVNKKNYSPLYGLRTCSHPQLHKYKSWYKTGEKRYPEDLTLTPQIAKMWFVCDGWLAVQPWKYYRVMFRCNNESDRPEYLTKLFEQSGFDSAQVSRETVMLTSRESRQFFEWIGPSIPGFGYKWPENRGWPKDT